MFARSNLISKSSSFVGNGIKDGCGSTNVCSIDSTDSKDLIAAESMFALLLLLLFEDDSVVDEVEDVIDDDWEDVILYKKTRNLYESKYWIADYIGWFSDQQ